MVDLFFLHCALGAGPAVFDDLAGAADGEGVFGNICGDARGRGYVRAFAHRTGATSVLSLPMKTPSSITVLCLLTPS